jgi:hypothetical protein
VIRCDGTAGAARKLAGKIPLRHKDFVFIDYGSGKGRVLMIASRWPFKFFYNPFQASVFRLVLEKLRKSLNENPRQMYLALVGSREIADLIESFGFPCAKTDAGIYRGNDETVGLKRFFVTQA